MTLKTCCFGLLVPMIACTASAEEISVTPYRPSVSSPAQLSTPGQLEFELGGLATRSDDSRRNSLPFLFKLAFSDNWGLLFAGEAYVWTRDGNDQHERGIGDTQLTLKRAYIVDPATAFGFELDAKIPSAKDAIGSGKADYTLNGIFSHDIGKVHMDANLNLTRLGVADYGASRVQTGASAAFSKPVAEQWQAMAELSGTRRTHAARTEQVLVAAAYSPSKQMTLDAGIAHGLNKASPDWSIFAGLVVPVTKLW